MVFLRGHQVSPALAQKIFRAYGQQSIEKVKSNPYAMAKEIFGIGFKTADQIGHNLGIPHNSALRIDAGVEHTLWELSNEGHVCYPKQGLIEDTKIDWDNEEKIGREWSCSYNKDELVSENEMIWVKPLYLCEIGIARELARLKLAKAALRQVDTKRAIVWIEEKLKISFARSKRRPFLQHSTINSTSSQAGRAPAKAPSPKPFWASSVSSRKNPPCRPNGKSRQEDDRNHLLPCLDYPQPARDEF